MIDGFPVQHIAGQIYDMDDQCANVFGPTLVQLVTTPVTPPPQPTILQQAEVLVKEVVEDIGKKLHLTSTGSKV